MMSSPQFRNCNGLLMFLIKTRPFDLALYMSPSTVQCMPLPCSIHPDCLPNITHLHSFKCVPLNEVSRCLHDLYCICVVCDWDLGYRQCLFIIVYAYPLSCPVQIRTPASPAARVKQSASHCLANYSPGLVQHYKCSCALTHKYQQGIKRHSKAQSNKPKSLLNYLKAKSYLWLFKNRVPPLLK